MIALKTIHLYLKTHKIYGNPQKNGQGLTQWYLVPLEHDLYQQHKRKEHSSVMYKYQ